jgi:hypothetical protein
MCRARSPFLVTVLAAAVLSGALAAVAPAASAITCRTAAPFAQLSGVAATSAASAWAVGGTSSGATGGSLILHWNGTAWKRVPSP